MHDPREGLCMYVVNIFTGKNVDLTIFKELKCITAPQKYEKFHQFKMYILKVCYDGKYLPRNKKKIY